MKELESLETQLRSWRPRRPSAGLDRRLLGKPSRLVSKTAWILGSLAPTAACALVTLAVFTHENSGGELRGVSMIATASSNSGNAEYELAGSRSGENNWSSVTFDWTNRSGITSSIAPFLRQSLH
jgi:hypothetical protein